MSTRFEQFGLGSSVSELRQEVLRRFGLRIEFVDEVRSRPSNQVWIPGQTKLKGLPALAAKLPLDVPMLHESMTVEQAEAVIKDAWGVAVEIMVTGNNKKRAHNDARIRSAGFVSFRSAPAVAEGFVGPPSVFISYRRECGSVHAQLVHQFLEFHGVRSFLDVSALRSGQYESQILNEIRARTHFLLVCTAGTLARCHAADDWIYKELSFAIRNRKVVVPFITDSFRQPDAATLPSGLAEFPKFQQFRYQHETWQETRNRLLRDLGVETPIPTKTQESTWVDRRP